jgi:hypothetical protein
MYVIFYKCTAYLIPPTTEAWVPGLPDGIFSDQKSQRVNFGGPCNGRCWYIYVIGIWYILRPFDIFYGHLVYFVLTWYVFPRFGILNQQKSGNPDGYALNFGIIRSFVTKLSFVKWTGSDTARVLEKSKCKHSKTRTPVEAPRQTK